MTRSSKILSIAAAQRVHRQLSQCQISLGICHGCFDVLHSGHIHHLTQAARHCDRLLISVTTARRINKGPERPIFGDEARLTVLAALEVVDYVLLNDDDSAVALLSALRPDFYFKGADYANTLDPRVIEEAETVRAFGGTFVLTDATVLDSSSRAASLLSIREGSR